MRKFFACFVALLVAAAAFAAPTVFFTPGSVVHHIQAMVPPGDSWTIELNKDERIVRGWTSAFGGSLVTYTNVTSFTNGYKFVNSPTNGTILYDFEVLNTGFVTPPVLPSVSPY